MKQPFEIGDKVFCIPHGLGYVFGIVQSFTQGRKSMYIEIYPCIFVQDYERKIETTISYLIYPDYESPIQKDAVRCIRRRDGRYWYGKSPLQFYQPHDNYYQNVYY